MDDPDLLAIGQHCEEANCRQKDFLPFTCDCCRKVFCLDHRTYSAHACPQARDRRETSIVCPLCARLVKVVNGEDANVVFEKHTQKDCEPSNYARVNKKPKCPVPGCREKLNLVNTHICKYCSTSVCLKHRFAEDHNCQNKPRPGSAQRNGAASVLSQLLGFGSPGSSQNKSNRQAASSSARSRESTKESHVRHREVRDQGQAVVRGQAGAAQALRQGGGGKSSTAVEVCPICTRSFENVSLLIEHSKEHQLQSTWNEICPHCRAAFPSAVLLVQHVETHHTDHKGCVVC